jgi:hypothetical protein
MAMRIGVGKTKRPKRQLAQLAQSAVHVGLAASYRFEQGSQMFRIHGRDLSRFAAVSQALVCLPSSNKRAS